jgi:hypothetical protein
MSIYFRTGLPAHAKGKSPPRVKFVSIEDTRATLILEAADLARSLQNSSVTIAPVAFRRASRQ